MPTPRINTKSYWDVEDVRQFILDRSVQDNLLDMDLQFSDEEIATAMRFACKAYNTIEPRIETILPDAIPLDLEIIINWGILYHLFLGLLHKLMRNDIDYTAGNVSVDINKRRIEHIKVLLPEYSRNFNDMALKRKVPINLAGYYRGFRVYP